MLSIDEVEIMLNEIAEEIPQELYRDLNGGIILLPEVKMHPKRKADDLYVMGEYHNSHDMGKYIAIYYGSFAQVHGYLPPELLRKKLKDALIHEFVHHVEALAGERGLEIKDAEFMVRYLSKHEGKE